MDRDIVILLTAIIARCSGGAIQQSGAGGPFLCSNGILLEGAEICNGLNDCGNWDDECRCNGSIPTLCAEQPCLNSQQKVRRRQLCDGVFDCNDLSDECLCDRQTEENLATYSLCQNLFENDLNFSACKVGSLHCYLGSVDSEKKECVDGKGICNGITNCLNGIDEMYCQNSHQVSLSNSTAEKHRRGNATLDDADGGLQTVRECEGFFQPHPDGSGDTNRSIFFYCNSSADLMNRNLSEMERTMFGDVPGVFIDWRRMFDGVQDCPDASDEWHPYFIYCPEKPVEGVECRGRERRRMSSPRYAIESRVFAVLQWVIGSATVIANGAVVVLTTRSLARCRAAVGQSVRRSNQVLVLSLCFSDLLLGVQMIAIGASDASMLGEFWKHDTMWMSSSFCLAIGFLAIALTQASILTIFVISVLRLYTVLRPFSVVRVKYVAFAALTVWAISIFVAKMPTMQSIPDVEDFFIQAVAVPNLPQVDATVLERTELNEVIKKMAVLRDVFYNDSVSILPVEKMRWRQLERFLNGINPEFTNWKYYSYFAHTSMCLPTVIVNVGGYAWEYAFITVLVDSLAYIFVVVAYVIVLKRTAVLKCAKVTSSGERKTMSRFLMRNRKSEDESTDPNRKVSTTSTFNKQKIRKGSREQENRLMQKRIFLLVFTDFLCWAPILVLNIINMISPQNKASVSKALGFCFILLQLNSMSNPLIYSRPVRRGAIAIILAPYRVVRYKILPYQRKSKSVLDDSEVTQSIATHRRTNADV